MVLEQGALSGKYDIAHPFPQGTGRGDAYNPILDKLEGLIKKLRELGDKYQVSPAQIAIAWAIYKGTLPIIGVTKVGQVKEVLQAIAIQLTDEEVDLLEEFGDKTNTHTLREWEKDMI